MKGHHSLGAEAAYRLLGCMEKMIMCECQLSTMPVMLQEEGFVLGKMSLHAFDVRASL